MRSALANPGWSHSVPLLAGDTGTAQTIDLIRSNVDEALKDPLIRQTAGMILMRAPAYNDGAEARTIYEWVKRNIRFVKDPVGKETVGSARWTLTHRFGDCDDINAVLLPALLGAAGYRTRLVTIASNPYAPEQFSHIYAEVLVRGRWIPVDAARAAARFGVAPQRAFRKKVWPVFPGDEDLGGLNGYQVHVAPRRPSRGMGGLADIIGLITKGATDIITTIRMPKAYVPTLLSQPPATGLPPSETPPSAPSTIAGIDSKTLLLGAAILGGAMLLSRKQR